MKLETWVVITFIAILGMAYVTSTQFSNWHFTPSELNKLRHDCNFAARRRLALTENEPKLEDLHDSEELNKYYGGLTAEQELKVVKRYIYLMKVLFDKFTNPKLPDEVYGFAVTYFKRFYLNHSVMNFYSRDMMLTCLYVACKSADFPIGIQTFISHIPRNQERYTYFILNSELFLLESLDYDLWVFTPYRALTGFIMDLMAYQIRIKNTQTNNNSSDQNYLTGSQRSDIQLVDELHQDGIELINLWYQTDLCLSVHPSQFALAVLVELGRTRPQFDVELFVRDELCGCDPIQKSKSNTNDRIKSTSSDDDEYDEEGENEDDDEIESGKKSIVNQSNQQITKISPETRWQELSSRLDFIRQTVEEFHFIVDLEPMSEEELLLDQCRNPLYNLESDEYAEAKTKADSLMNLLE